MKILSSLHPKSNSGALIVIGLAFLAGLALLSPYAVPAPVKRGSTTGPIVQIYAHRGGRKWAPENTLAAFRKSLALGVDGIELDIHRCRSGQLIVIHDERVDRTTDGAGLIKDLTLEELNKLSAGAKFADGKEFRSERLPLLQDVLALVDGKMVINIEIKNSPVQYPGIEDDLAALLSKYKDPDKIIVSSFDHAVIQKFHQKAPQYKTAMLADCILFDVGSYARSVGASAYNPAFSDFRQDAVNAAHRAGLAVNVWTLNSQREWSDALAWGVDGIITDDPAGLKEYLGAAH